MKLRILIALHTLALLTASLVSAQEQGTVVPTSCATARETIAKNAAKRNWYTYPSGEKGILKVMNIPGMGAMIGAKMIPVAGLFLKNVQFGTLVFENVKDSEDACTITPAGKPAKALLKELVKAKKASGGK